MRRHRNAKIVATLGPASASEAMIRSLFFAGVDVFRLNFSHGTHEQHRERLQQIRNVERDLGRPIGVLAEEGASSVGAGTSLMDLTLTAVRRSASTSRTSRAMPRALSAASESSPR